MAKPVRPWQRTLAEIRRRRVLRAIGAYAVVLWFVLQVSDVVLPALGAPAWAMTLLVMIGILGIPVTIAASWVYDLTAEGIQRTRPLSDAEVTITSPNYRWVDYVVIAALLIVLVLVLNQRPDSIRSPAATIAVLPFSDLSSDQAHRYLGDGIAEAIMDRLAHIPGLRVSARTSSFSFRSGDTEARRVADALEVDHLLEGSVRRHGDRLRISARLVDGRDGNQSWSETFEGSFDEVFQLQDRIASAVAQVMQLRLDLDGDEAQLTSTSHAAYDLYLRGRDSLRRKSTSDEIAEAIQYFEQALALDPDFALAAAGLCRALWERYELSRDPDQVGPAMAHCRDVERRYPEQTETRIAIGMLLRGTGQSDRAAAVFRQALNRSPYQAEAHAGLSLALRDMELFDQARAEIQQAIRLDPAYWRYHWLAGVLDIQTGQRQRGINSLRRSIQLNPDTPEPYYSLGAAHFLEGEFLFAADAFSQSIDRYPNAIAFSNAGTNYFYGGEFARAEAMFEQALALSPDDFRYSGFLAWAIRAQAGREAEAEAFHWQVIRAATERLAINNYDYEARAALALHLAALGHEPSARGALASLADRRSLNVNVLTSLGLTHHLLGEPGPAAAAYRAAIEQGLPRFLIEADPRLRGAHQHAEFADIFATPKPSSTIAQGTDR